MGMAATIVEDTGYRYVHTGMCAYACICVWVCEVRAHMGRCICNEYYFSGGNKDQGGSWPGKRRKG